MKKIIRNVTFLFLIVCVMNVNSSVNADPIVELAAPRVLNQKSIPDFNLDSKPNAKAASVKGKHLGKHKKSYLVTRKKHKKIVIKPDYRKLSKLVEYGYYNYADSKLQSLVAKNPKDLKAQATLTISMAKQFQLESAQKNVNKFLKLYPKNSDFHYAQGIIYFQRTHSSNMQFKNNADDLTLKALNEFKKAIALDKNNAKAYNAAGVISLLQGNNADAKKYFTQAVKIDDAYSMAIDNLGTIDFIDQKYSDAEKKFKQALVFNTKNSTAMYHLAQISMQKQDYPKAIYYLNNALALNPNSPAVSNLIGKAYERQGNEAAAITAYKKAISLNPEFTLSYMDLAKVYEKRGDKPAALEQLKTALNLNSSNEIKLKIADISYADNDYSQAITFYTQLLGQDGYNESALKGLANSYYAKAQISTDKSYLGTNQDLLDALDLINKAILTNNQDLELHLAKLKLNDITNQPIQPKVVLKQIIMTPSTDLQSQVTKGEAYLALYNYDNAQKCFSKAINLSTTPENDFYLTEIFLYLKQYDAAQKTISKILKYDSKNTEALSALDYIQKSKILSDNYYKSAMGILITRNYTLAAEYFSKSINVNPNNAQAHLRLAKIYDKQNNTQNAISNYKAYLGLSPYAPDTNKIKRRISCLENKL